MNVAAAIIGGGRARRMGGRPKHLLEIEGRRIVDRQLDVLRPMFAEVIAVASDPALWADAGLRVVPDRVADSGPLAGIDAALAALPEVDAVVCVACDMPFLTPEALALLVAADPSADAAAPRVGGRPEPLFARYGRTCAGVLRDRLDAGALTAMRFFDHVRVAWIEEPVLRALDPTLRFLRNVNVPDDAT